MILFLAIGRGTIGSALFLTKDVDPMKSAIPHHVAFFVYPGFVLLDLSGPLEAFSSAESLVPGNYRTTVMSLEGGEVQSSTGLKVMTQVAQPDAIDTFVVVGDLGLAHQTIAHE